MNWLSKTPNGVGRPRSLERDAVIDAAVTLGLDRFSMKRVAEHLGVGIATLYQYVKNRDELLRLAIERQLETVDLPGDCEQHWSEYVIEYATSLKDALASEPHLILQVMDGGGGIERELAVTERFVEVLVARGFAIDEAVGVWRTIGAITLGAAIAICRDRAAEARSGSSARMLRQAFAHFEPDQLPLMRKGQKAYAKPVDLVGEMLLPIVESIGRRRGEVMPWDNGTAPRPTSPVEVKKTRKKQAARKAVALAGEGEEDEGVPE
ncbi:TetR/AcrR family transcriptional regulator [Sphingomonas sp. C3-2]|uniref:TetR/AcrR family transcriptional regulator n=1 Tax=Sphingomonas sp. C3-2 TaxID=3062169 RepID=UPI00294B4D54|nr:TetR family transcriptional regulator [Sphingomonas sp. C3-2]WOK37539.1 TetR family transcriptional regulator [Sphingomonas sp. C3-2]